jgi:hypothetical protein
MLRGVDVATSLVACWVGKRVMLSRWLKRWRGSSTLIF